MEGHNEEDLMDQQVVKIHGKVLMTESRDPKIKKFVSKHIYLNIYKLTINSGSIN
jgi:hypothetical protein